MRRPNALRAWLPAGVLATYGVLEVLSGLAPGVGEVPGDKWVSGTTAAAIGMALGLRRERPLGSLLVALAAFGIEALLTEPAEGLAPLLTLLLLVYGVASISRLWASVAALGAAVAVLGAASGDLVFVAVLLAVPWLAGRVVGERQRQLAELQVSSTEQAASAVVEERQRIARDLHDVVSHALSLIAVQAQVGEATVRSDPDAAARALCAVRGAAQQALADMRRMLGVLSDAGELGGPQLGLADLPSLLAQVRAAGLDVRVREHGPSRDLTPGASLTAYRVLQEGLTNVLRHAGSRRAEVVVEWAPAALALRVRDHGGPGAGAGAGRGLVGLRERVHVFGGTLRAGPVEGGFELEAVLPA